MATATLAPVAPIYFEDVELYKLTGVRSSEVQPYFFRSEQVAGLLQQVKRAGSDPTGTPWTSFASQLDSNLSSMRSKVPAYYVQTLWERGLARANVGGLPQSFDTWRANIAGYPPDKWGSYTGPAVNFATDPGPSDPSLFPPYTAPPAVILAGNEVPDCNGQYPSGSSECMWPHPQGLGAAVTLVGPPGPLGRSFFPCPAGYVPDPVTGKCVAATDALWYQLYPSARPNNANPNLPPQDAGPLPPSGAGGVTPTWVDGDPIPGTVSVGPSSLPGPTSAPPPIPNNALPHLPGLATPGPQAPDAPATGAPVTTPAPAAGMTLEGLTRSPAFWIAAVAALVALTSRRRD
jgi:hypothetical protein